MRSSTLKRGFPKVDLTGPCAGAIKVASFSEGRKFFVQGKTRENLRTRRAHTSGVAFWKPGLRGYSFKMHFQTAVAMEIILEGTKHTEVDNYTHTQGKLEKIVIN
jgi:hypothetical protein